MSEAEVVQTETAPPAETEEVKGEIQQQPAVDKAEKEEPQKEDESAKKDGLNKRFSELTRKRREAEERADRAEKALAEYQASQAKKDDSAAEPKLEDFETFEAYSRALVRWEAAEVLKQERSKAAEEDRKRAHEMREAALREEWAVKADIARGKYQDFDAVAFNPQVQVSQPVLEAILDSDLGAEIAYHLGKNPDLAARISQMHHVSAAREIGRLEAQLQNQPPPPLATKAPEPIEPVGQRAQAAKDPSQMTDAEFAAWRKRQIAQRR